MTIKILLAIPQGYKDTPAVDRARALAAVAEVDLMLYSAVYDAQLSGLRHGDLEKMRAAMVDSEAANLADLQADLATVARSVEVQTQWAYPIAESINAAAQGYGAHFILASSTQHSAVSRLVLSNTDWALLRASQLPVLFARQQPFRAYKNVLAAVDPTHAHDEPAELDGQLIKAGRRFAGLFDGELHLGHAYPSGNITISPEYVMDPQVALQWRTQHTAAVNDLAEEAGIDADHVHLLDEEPGAAVVGLAESIDAELVVLGSVSRSFRDRMMIGRTTERVLDGLACDVLTVPAGADVPDW